MGWDFTSYWAYLVGPLVGAMIAVVLSGSLRGAPTRVAPPQRRDPRPQTTLRPLMAPRAASSPGQWLDRDSANRYGLVVLLIMVCYIASVSIEREGGAIV